MSRYLTKSRFKLAVECPTKLFYTKKKDTYSDNKNDNDFLKALADGGFQVGELAKLMYPSGVEAQGNNDQELIQHTNELLSRENVIIYEAAIVFENLYARVDVLKKTGTRIDLIEVKAKSFDSTKPDFYKAKAKVKGELKKDILPYFQDIAFQTYLFNRAFPNQYEVHSYLMLADKSKKCSIDGLNQFFKIKRVNDRPIITVDPKASFESIGDPILTAYLCDDIVHQICGSNLLAPGFDLPFGEAVQVWSDHYSRDEQIPPFIGEQCAKCEFRNDEHPDLKSGLFECWQIANDEMKREWSDEEFKKGTVLDIWNFKKKGELIQNRILKFIEILPEHIKPKSDTDSDGLSNFDRQWMQISKEIPGGGSFYLDRELMQKEMSSWKYPLNFIDFETSRVAIPFFKVQEPYFNTAFQFSHHVMQEGGQVSHQTDFLSTTPGKKPNYDFVRALQKTLGQNSGTVFMWWPHENTTLNAILDELDSDQEKPEDYQEMKDFILSITYKKHENSKEYIRCGERVMVDLCTLSKKAFFHPSTNASSSIKKVLPAVMQDSEYLKDKYSTAIYGKNKLVTSLNFESQIWWQIKDGKVVNPYELLPKVFEDFTEEELRELNENVEDEINQGGAATTAYARLQFENLDNNVREKTEQALKKYCELDTFAMVMIVEAWREWINP
jgi:hypothetical protein